MRCVCRMRFFLILITALILLAVSYQFFVINIELKYYKRLTAIKIGMTDDSVSSILGSRGNRDVEMNFPQTLGAIPQYKYGCYYREFMISDSGTLEKSICGPDTKIVWYIWKYSNAKWIAVAFLGDHYQRNSSQLIAVYKCCSESPL
jgi:hypothetical protein